MRWDQRLDFPITWSSANCSIRSPLCVPWIQTRGTNPQRFRFRYTLLPLPPETQPSLGLFSNLPVHLEFWGSTYSLVREPFTPWELQEASSTSLLDIILLQKIPSLPQCANYSWRWRWFWRPRAQSIKNKQTNKPTTQLWVLLNPSEIPPSLFLDISDLRN